MLSADLNNQKLLEYSIHSCLLYISNLYIIYFDGHEHNRRARGKCIMSIVQSVNMYQRKIPININLLMC